MADPKDNIQVHRLKILLLVSALASLSMLLLSAFEENLTGEWRQHQEAYRQALIQRAKGEKDRLAAEKMNIKFKQLFLPELKRVDRCVTCHVGIEDPAQANAPQPLAMHSGDLLKYHPIDKFGCTVCHDGQGRAIHKDDAHGDVPHWDKPLKSGKETYTTCSRCHYENDLFGAEADRFAKGGLPQAVDQEELSASVKGAVDIARGKQLVMSAGCLGCHKYRGKGGHLGPDITFVGDKIAHDFDFKHIQGEHTAKRWFYEHFMNPEKVSPGSLMPDMGFTEQQAQDLTHYMMSLQDKKFPASYTPLPPRRSGKLATGKQLYNMFCSSCHGKNGEGSTARINQTSRAIDAPAALMVPSLSHPDTLAVASDDYLRFVIQHGRDNSNMPAWKAGSQGGVSGGLEPEEIDRIIRYIRHWQPKAPELDEISAKRGNVHNGKLIYTLNCASCHGAKGQGGIGPSLNSPSFLAIASDRYLAKTIVNGRPNTAMSSYRFMSAQAISDLIAYLRSFQPHRAIPGKTLALASGADNEQVSVAIGKILFNDHCVTCHGQNGKGDLALSINTQAFLTLADNRYLFDTITRGRPGTGMPAWHHLPSEDVASLIKYIRSWQKKPSVKLSADRIPGYAASGQLVYKGACASCHGSVGQGAVGPAIGNKAFLETASDAMLKQWISYGKTGTAMLGFLKGQQGPVELSESQINDVIAFLHTLPEKEAKAVAISPQGRPDLGRKWYANACASCHGEHGQGASGPSLSNPSFLSSVSDGFLMATLAMGREGTEMRPVKKGADSILSLSSDQLNDVVAFLRTWQTEPAQGGAIPHHYVVPRNMARGKRLYLSNCSGCHGVDGKAERTEPGLSAWAPQLNNEQFLQAATDGYLQATIARGRMGTAMRPFGRGAQGVVEMSMQEIDDIVAYIRHWSKLSPGPMSRAAQRSVSANHSKNKTSNGKSTSSIPISHPSSAGE